MIADLHCGHEVGLTPPLWQPRGRARFTPVRRELWNEYTRMIDAQKPIDILVVNGDAIDGKGQRSGGTEQITADRSEQAAMAIECIKYAEAETIVMTYGTPYHAGNEEDYEGIIAKELGCPIKSHAFIDINGLKFSIKHKIGGSSVPHGRATAMLREMLWDLIWSDNGEQPRDDVIIRSHVHYFMYVGDKNRLGIVTPALQGLGSKYGARQCPGTVDFGIINFKIFDSGDYIWGKDIAKVRSQNEEILKL